MDCGIFKVCMIHIFQKTVSSIFARNVVLCSISLELSRYLNTFLLFSICTAMANLREYSVNCQNYSVLMLS